jgi:hypothetical protein
MSATAPIRKYRAREVIAALCSSCCNPALARHRPRHGSASPAHYACAAASPRVTVHTMSGHRASGSPFQCRRSSMSRPSPSPRSVWQPTRRTLRAVQSCPVWCRAWCPLPTAAIFGGSGRTGTTGSKNCAVVACQSSMSRLPPVHRRGSGAYRDTRRSNKRCATTLSTHSVCPDSLSLPKLNLVEPPWYGPVCRWCGRGAREVSPYPGLGGKSSRYIRYRRRQLRVERSQFGGQDLNGRSMALKRPTVAPPEGLLTEAVLKQCAGCAERPP